MKKINIIKKNTDFSRIIKNKNAFFNNVFILNVETNNDNIPKFGITFTKNIANAVTRNKLKRQIKSIIDNNKNVYEKDKNYIIIIKKEAIEKNYCDLEKQLLFLFKKLKEKQNEKNN